MNLFFYIIPIYHFLSISIYPKLEELKESYQLHNYGHFMFHQELITFRSGSIFKCISYELESYESERLRHFNPFISLHTPSGGLFIAIY